MRSTPATAVDPLQVALKNGRLFVRLSSFFSLLAGLSLLLLPMFRHAQFSSRLERIVLPANLESAADLTELLTGLALLYLAYELLQRKRSAWLVALTASMTSMALQLYFGGSTVHTAFMVFVITALLVGRNEFVIRAHPVHLWQGIRTLAASIVVALAYGTLGFWLLDKRDFGTTFSFTESFEHTLKQYLLLGNSDLHAHTRYGHWFLSSLTIVGVTTLLYCLFSILRPLRYELRTAPSERALAQQLLEMYGGGIDDYFKLWPPDKSYFFSRDRDAFIAYGVARGVALCFADPEGKPESIPGLLRDFTAYCFANGWLIAFIAASNKHAELFHDQHFEKVLIGADAVINLDKFTTQTSRNKYFRNISNRFEKGGFSTTRHMPPHPAALINELRTVSNDWLKIPGHKQWRFLTGYFSARYFRGTPLFVVRDERGKALAFVNELPTFQEREATIDLMRHRRDAPKNTMDYLFMSLMLRLHQEGYTTFNLGLSPMARQSFSDTRSRGLLDYIYLASQRFIATKGLHQYKAKFDPEWEPRYVYYIGSGASLPQVGLALAKLSTFR